MVPTPDGPARPDELLRKLREHIDGGDLASLTSLAHHLMSRGRDLDPFGRPAPPSARRPRRNDVVTFRVRVDLQGTKPPLWRRLELASTMLLSELHEVLQIAFGWTDSHLHRFSSGSSIYDGSAEAYLMPFEVEEGEPGIPECEVRVDELLVDVGDRISYGYDFGDDWMHTVKLEAVLPRDAAAPRAVCTTGRRRTPAEDCGGVGAFEAWCAANDPSHPEHAAARDWIANMFGPEIDPGVHAPIPFDIDEINRTLAAPPPGAQDLPGPLAELVRRVLDVRCATRLEATIAGIPPADAPDADTATVAVGPFTWLLDRVGADGITLTGAGYLPPAHVQAVAEAIGIAETWIGKVNREIQTYPVLAFREAAHEVKLVRKHRGRLVLTPAGRRVRADPVGLWRHLATQLPLGAAEHERHAGLLLLIGLAAGWDDLDARIAEVMRAIGWATDHGPLRPMDAHRAAFGTRQVLQQLGGIEGGSAGDPERLTGIGAAFVRAALWTWP